MRRLIPTLALGLGSCLASQAQLYVDNATFFIESGATVTVQGDLTSNVDIQGPGKILLKGSTLQNVNMNNGGGITKMIPNLEIDNAAGVQLTGNTKVGTNLTFTNGKILAGNFNFVLANLASVTGAGTSKFIETVAPGTGFAQRELVAASSNLLIPVGVGTDYTPITLSHASGTYSATSLVGAQARVAKSPNAPIASESYTNAYWPVATSNITGGMLTGVGNYSGFAGTETDIKGMSFNGTDWALTDAIGVQDPVANTVTGKLTTATGQVFGMNQFVLLNAKVLLQGASPVAGVMADGLRTGTSVIPLTEPYRTAPYSFATTNPLLTREAAAAGVFADLGTKSVVDWVFVELRSGASGSAVLEQSRSALLLRDGSIVDFDGTSSLYFKNLPAASYTVTVKHRNHLPISTNLVSGFTKALTLSAFTPVLDFTTIAAASVLGAAGTNYLNAGGYNMMYAGNANFNANVRYSGSANDKDYILSTPLGTNPALVLTGVYNQGDVNMNKVVRYSGSANDKDYLLSAPLGGNPALVKSQIIPN